MGRGLRRGCVLWCRLGGCGRLGLWRWFLLVVVVLGLLFARGRSVNG